MLDLNKLTTEKRNPNSTNLDQMSALEIVDVMNKEDEKVAIAVAKQKPNIAKAIELCAKTLASGGRIVYVGAGTSGRLGLLDAVECPPTFGVDYDTVICVLAGGDSAFVKAKENAEDSIEDGKKGLIAKKVTSKDIIIGIAASGRTPFVIGALNYGNEIGCETIAIACNLNSKVGKIAKLAIEVDNGPEILTGSTRLKSGTSQKMILNMISTGSMILNGKTYSNLMVDVKQTNEKLVARAIGIVMQATSCTNEVAKKAIKEANGQVKTAVTMILLNCDSKTATDKLSQANGHVRKAISEK